MPITFVATERVRVRIRILRSGEVVRTGFVSAFAGANRVVFAKTNGLQAGRYILAVDGRNARGGTRVHRAAFIIR